MSLFMMRTSFSNPDLTSQRVHEPLYCQLGKGVKSSSVSYFFRPFLLFSTFLLWGQIPTF